MKKRFLPFSFFVSLIALAVVLNGFRLYDGNKTNAVKQTKSVQEAFKSGEYLRSLRNNQKTGKLEPQLVAYADEQIELLENNSRSANEIEWSVMGPNNFGGRTRAIIYDNKDASGNTVYAGAVTGGLWRSTDNATTWTKINADNQNLYVSCMTQAANGTIYVGTGESFDADAWSQLYQLGYSSGFMGTGLYKSTDGENFELIDATKPQANNADGDWAFINAIEVDGNGRLYAATNTGLKYSDDDGNTWKTAKDDQGNELSGNSYDVKTAGSMVVTTVDNQCFVSSGDAEQFVNHSTGEADQLPVGDEVRRIEFAVAPSDNNIVYASLINNNGYLKGVYRSDNGGDTWSVILPETNSMIIFWGGGEYFNTITVFPNDPDKVLLGGYDLWVGFKTNDSGLFFWEQKSSSFGSPLFPNYLGMMNHVYVFRPGHVNQFLVGTSQGIFKGQYSGNEYTYKSANLKYYTTQFYRVANSGIGNYVIGGAQENGVLSITNQTNTPGYANYISSNYGCDEAISLINPDVIVFSSVGGNIFRSEDRGENVSTQFLTKVIKNPNAFITPFALWESFDNENSRDSLWYHARKTIPAGTAITIRSANSGYPFSYTVSQDMQEGDSVQVVDPVSSRLFIAVDGAVFMTKELHLFGKTPQWFEIANGSVGFVGQPNAIAYSADCNHLWVGTIDGNIYRISNLALAYNKELADVNEPTCIVANSSFQINDPSTGDPITQAVTSISVDPENPAKVMVTFANYGNDNYIFYTTNALDESPLFESKQGNLAKMPVYASVIEMSNSNTAIIGTEKGVFVTNNLSSASPDWKFESDYMGKVPVYDIRQQITAQPKVTLELINGIDTSILVYPGATNYGSLYAATYGRGIVRSDTYRLPVGIDEFFVNNLDNSTASLKVYPNPVKNTVYFEFETAKSETARVYIYNQAGMLMATQNVVLNNGNNRTGVDVSNLSTGSYIIKVIKGTEIRIQKFVKL